MDKNLLFEKVFSKHSKLLKNLDFDNSQKLVIAFSGVPGSGKSTLAKKIEEKYNGVRLSNDDIRSLLAEELQESSITEQVHTLGKEYLFYLISTLVKGPNHLIILDSSIDRTFINIKEWADKNLYPIVTIKLDTSREEVIERIKDRNSNFEEYLSQLDRQWNDYVKFNNENSVDFVYKSEVDDVGLFEFLDEKAFS